VLDVLGIGPETNDVTYCVKVRIGYNYVDKPKATYDALHLNSRLYRGWLPCGRCALHRFVNSSMTVWSNGDVRMDGCVGNQKYESRGERA